MLLKIIGYGQGKFNHKQILDSFQGWNAYAKWASTGKLRERVLIQLLNKG